MTSPTPTRLRPATGLAATVAARRAAGGARPPGTPPSHGTSAGKPAPEQGGAPPASDTWDPLGALRISVRAAVLKELGPRLSTGEVDEGRVRTIVRKQLDSALRTSAVSISPAEREEFLDAVLADMLGWGPLTALMNDPSVTEVMCNGPDRVFVERNGKLESTAVRFTSGGALRQVVDRMLAVAGRRVDEASPMADGRLQDGSRINVIIPPLSLSGPVLTVRRFPEQAYTVTDLIAKETLSTEAAVFLEAAVRGKLNIVVSGGTGSGKTTLLNVLSSFVPADERIITIEDAAELRLAQPHVVTLESRPANIEGAGEISIRQLVRNALRMRPDRIVVGEVRSGEALDMLQAMNTGHEGSLTTVHANTGRDALLRIETMVLMSGVELPLRAIREQIASAFDLIIQLDRRPDGSRAVTAICELQGREGDTVVLQDVFLRGASGPLTATGLRPRVQDKLASRGIELPGSVLRRTGLAAGGARRPAPASTRSGLGHRGGR